MYKKILYALLWLAPAIGFSQSSPKFEQLPATTQTAFKQIAAKHDTGMVSYGVIEKDIHKNGIDLGKMPIEDAIMMMFALISEDARKDMKDMLAEMDKTRQKKAALREAKELMKKELDSLKDRARDKNRPDSLILKTRINERSVKLQQYTSEEKLVMAAQNKADKDVEAAEKHLRSVEEAISLLRAKKQ